MQKHKKDKNTGPELSQYEQQVELKRRFKTMLENEQLIPRVRVLSLQPRASRGCTLNARNSFSSLDVRG